MPLTAGQKLALTQLEAIAVEGDAVELLRVDEPLDPLDELVVEITLRCAGFRHQPGGLRLRDRERFHVRIAPDFPFKEPSVDVAHQEWAGHAHVQWSSHLCLYQAPTTEWDPADGIFGFVDRLRFWLEKGALGELDPVGGPLHPPAAYARDWSLPMVVPRADTPDVADAAWLGLAELRQVSDRRVDIVGWANPLREPWPEHAAVAVLLPRSLTWEYPTRVKHLLDEFDRQGVNRRLLLALLQFGAFANEEAEDLYVVVGSPMRGVAGGERRQHLEVWYLRDEFVKRVRSTTSKPTDTDEIAEIRQEMEELLLQIADLSPVEFCVVREDRPEVTERRDAGSPLEAFRGRTVAIWGCGALGGWIGEALTRSGVRKLILYDNAVVTPGILVRQPYDDADLGFWKVQKLRERLQRIRPDIVVEARAKNVLTTALETDEWADDAEVIVDATAAIAVATKLERHRRLHPKSVTVISMLLGHRAERGLVAIAHPDAVGSAGDVVRRAKLACASRVELRGFLNEFWPDPPRTEVFQPEPGCSDATFRGSAAEVLALGMAMLTAAAQELATRNSDEPAVAHLLALPAADHEGRREVRLAWPADVLVGDGLSDYQIRIAEHALAEIRAWSRRTGRIIGPRVETGGLIFGQRDDAAGVIWLTEVTGPPPDSVQSEAEFVCGTAGNDRFRAEKHSRGRGSIEFLGMWHTHPGGSAMPSERDILSMTALVLNDDPPLPKSLALIVGGTPDDLELGGYVFDRADYKAPFVELVFHDRTIRPGPARAQSRNVGLAFSGGGARAIAFHLGCLRALVDRDVLGRVAVVSGVSGGAVMSAAWVYSDEEFVAFDARIVALLRRGLTRGTTRRALAGRAGLRAIAATGTAGVASLLARFATTTVGAASRLPGVPRRRLAGWRLEPPLRRFASRTDALRDTLSAELFEHSLMTSSRRENVDVVLNACELRSGSAFRFGSRESSCWRFGTVDGNRIEVAEAVAASAAYPVFLPALDREWRFVRRDGRVEKQRVVLTDGGVYDNLGTSCLEPGRSADFTYNIFPVDYIIACDAGRGLLTSDPVPYFWVSRMKRSFESIFRKAQDAGRARLHQYAADGQLTGFVMPYLGNRDHVLPVQPADLVPREAVVDYPTDFSAMPDEDIERLALRGEQLTRLLIDHYCPEL